MDQSYFRFLFQLARKSKQSGLSKSEKSLAERNVTFIFSQGFSRKKGKFQLKKILVPACQAKGYLQILLISTHTQIILRKVKKSDSSHMNQ